MSIFSRLFGKAELRSHSYVRTWVEKKSKTLKNETSFTPENFFILIMYGLVGFNKDAYHQNSNKFSKNGNNHSGDSSLFELGCYLLFILDLWLFQNHKFRRNEIMSQLMDRFVDLFNEAFGLDIEHIINERLKNYGKQVQNVYSSDEVNDLLKKLILLSNGNEIPKSYDFDNFQRVYVSIDLSDEMGVTVSLTSWNAYVLPSLLDQLKIYSK